MSPYTDNEEYPVAATETIDSDTCTSILNWIDQIDTSTPTSSISQSAPSTQLYQLSPIRHSKRRRSSDSLPSEFLGDRCSLRKRRRSFQAMAANMSPPFTPSSKSAPTSSGEPYTPANKSTPSRTTVAGLKDLKNPDTVGQIMEVNHLMHNDRVAFNRYPVFKEKILRVIGANRESAMRPESHIKFEAYLDCYERSNEATFLRNIFPLLMKDGYYLRNNSDFTDTEKQLFEKREYLEYRDFLLDEGILNTADREFLKTLVPSSCNKDAEIEIAKLLAKVAGMTNPKPDYTFGMMRQKFPRLDDVVMPEYIAALLGIAPGMYHAFLLVEGKPDAGSQAEAENQARRGGATLVHAERKLRGLIEEVVDIEGPDEECFVFSVTLTPKVAEFWAHWYEGKGPKQSGFFHMNRIASLTLNEEVNRETIRRTMHNIMEWGGMSGPRFNKKLELHQSIHAYVRDEHGRNKANGSSRKKQKTEGSIQQELGNGER